MTKKRARRSGRITLRVSPELHDELAGAADSLGLDINGLLNLMIRRSFGRVKLEAAMLKAQSGENIELIMAWQEENRGRPVREFWDDYLKYARSMGDVRKGLPGPDEVEVFDFEQMDMVIQAIKKVREKRHGESQETGPG